MEITFFGVRGSFPTALQSHMKYGGNTSCVFIETACGGKIILDGGTGLRSLGMDFMQQDFAKGSGHACMLFSHTMWDHIQGFPFFYPLYIPGNSFDIYCSPQNGNDIRALMEGQQSNVYAAQQNEFKADIFFHDISDQDSFNICCLDVSTVRLNHSENTLGFRLQSKNSVVTYMTDTAPFKQVLLGKDMEKEAKKDRDAYIAKRHQALVEANRDADVMIFDTHFTPEQIKGKEHWGHSSFDYAAEVAIEAGVKAVALFHYAPENDDDKLDEVYAFLLKKNYPFDIIMSKEGSSIFMKE